MTRRRERCVAGAEVAGWAPTWAALLGQTGRSGLVRGVVVIYFADGVELNEEALSPELVELLERVARFERRPRWPPIVEPEPICWRAPDGGAA